MRSRSARPRLVYRLLAAVLGLLFALFLSEAIVRIARNFVCTPHSSLFFVRHPDYGWTHQSGRRVLVQGCRGRATEFRAKVQFNSKGLRGDELPYVSTGAGVRVLMLGDSLTEAVQVPLDLTFAKKLEKVVSSGVGAAEVINAGTAGYGTDQELLYYRFEGWRYQPDLVLLIFNFQNDIAENYPTTYRREYDDRGANWPAKPFASLDETGRLVFDSSELQRQNTTPAEHRSVWQLVEESFYLVRLVKRHFSAASLLTTGAPRLPRALALYADPASAEAAEALTLTEALLRNLRDEVQGRGSQFGVVLVPAGFMVDPRRVRLLRSRFTDAGGGEWDIEGPRRRIVSFLARENIASVDLTPVLRNHLRDAGSDGFFQYNPHLNAEGHDVVASALAEWITREFELGTISHAKRG